MAIDPELLADVKTGRATDDQLAEFVGPDLMIELGTQWRSDIENAHLFANWYSDVAEPLGVPRDAAENLFYGRVAIEEFVDGLSEDVIDAFLERFEGLQRKHLLKLQSSRDRGGAL